MRREIASWIAATISFSATLALAADLASPVPAPAPPAAKMLQSPGLMPMPVHGETSPSPSPGSDLMNDLNIQDPRSLRDPFKRPQDQFRAGVPRSELEQYPLTDFKMTGVFNGLHRRRAIVKREGGKVFIVSEGMKIGVREGVITQILDDRIVVRENTLDRLGEHEYENHELVLLPETHIQPEASPSPLLIPFSSFTNPSSPTPAEAAPLPSPSSTGGGT